MKKKIQLHDLEFEEYISRQEINNIIDDLAQDINSDYRDKKPIILSILNGSFVFASDLVRALDFDMTLEFVRYASYEGVSTTGEVKEILGLKSSIQDQDVLIIEDIVDTGNTLAKALVDLQKQKPSSLKVVSLLLKPDALQHDIPVDYVGKRIPNDFVVGYGLDYDELGRNLADIYVKV